MNKKIYEIYKKKFYRNVFEKMDREEKIDV